MVKVTQVFTSSSSAPELSTSAAESSTAAAESSSASTIDKMCSENLRIIYKSEGEDKQGGFSKLLL